MSYSLSGVNFVSQLFTPTSDAALWKRCVSDGILEHMELSYAGSSLSVAAGWFMAGGKELQNPSALTVPVTGQLSGYARLVATVDLTKTATEETFSQAWLDLEYADSLAGFADLTQEDLAGSGTVYQLVVCVLSLGSAGITGIVSTCGHAHARAGGVELSLPAAGWSNNQQTVRCDGVHADTNVQAGYAPASRDDWQNAGIWLYAQGDGTLTFKCDTAPAVDVTVNVLLS